ncbi:hypothetical protein R0K18_30120, partial [Pantoea sp. SIMBA_133]
MSAQRPGPKGPGRVVGAVVDARGDVRIDARVDVLMVNGPMADNPRVVIRSGGCPSVAARRPVGDGGRHRRCGGPR